jgi:hypothetical protein
MDGRERRPEGRGHDYRARAHHTGAGAGPSAGAGTGAGYQCQAKARQEAAARRGPTTRSSCSEATGATACRRQTAPPGDAPCCREAPRSCRTAQGGKAASPHSAVYRLTARAPASRRGKAPDVTDAAASCAPRAAIFDLPTRRTRGSRTTVDTGAVAPSHVPAGGASRPASATAGAQARAARRRTADQRPRRRCSERSRNAAAAAKPACRTPGTSGGAAGSIEFATVADLATTISR